MPPENEPSTPSAAPGGRAPTPALALAAEPASNAHGPGPVITQTTLAARRVLDEMVGMAASDVTTANAEWACVDMLALGHRLGLWIYVAIDPNAENYVVRINGRDRRLHSDEVRGWVLGVLDAVALPVGPFRYREGL